MRSQRILSRTAKRWRLYAAFQIVVLCCTLLFVNATAATFTASLDRDTITLGETATLSLTFEGGSPDNVPMPPANPNLQVVEGGTSTQFKFINGQSSSTITHSFRLIPRQPGDYTIPAMTVDVSGEKLSSQPVVLKVVKPNAPAPDAINSGTELAFLKLILPRKQVYVGESFTAQLQLHLLNRVQGVNQVQLTAFPADGFSVGKMIEGQRRQVQVGNGIYTVIPIEVALKAIKSGPLTIGPVTFSMVIELPSAGRQRDIFDPFGMFNHGEQKQISVATAAEQVQSLTVPHQDAPPDFNGAIGRFTMNMTAGPTNVSAGDPITVRIQISGRGSLDGLTLPEQPGWNDFKTYPPTAKVETTDQLGLQGTKTFEQIVTPQNSEIKALPPVSFSFFDPDAKAFRTLTQPPIPLAVRPGGSVAAPTVLGSQKGPDNNAPASQDIVPNKQRMGTLAQIGPPLAQQGWFLVLQSVPLVAFVSAVVLRRRAESLANNPRLRRRREVAHVVQHGLQDLRKSAAENNSEQFFAIMVRLLQEQLGERLDVPASAITEAVIDERLKPRGVSESITTALQELFQLSNLARYAPIKTSQELAALIPKIEALLAQLKDLPL
ncbi:MAG TPA: BatD family protein [Verrucomicrobiae bacterium]|nr:BatD family protein [Verrucomicrobiae bacterium]